MLLAKCFLFCIGSYFIFFFFFFFFSLSLSRSLVCVKIIAKNIHLTANTLNVRLFPYSHGNKPYGVKRRSPKNEPFCCHFTPKAVFIPGRVYVWLTTQAMDFLHGLQRNKKPSFDEVATTKRRQRVFSFSPWTTQTDCVSSVYSDLRYEEANSFQSVNPSIL